MKNTISIFWLLVSLPTFALAQRVRQIEYLPSSQPSITNATDCNFAGTYAIGYFSGQSNDISPDTVYLCMGDTLLLDHDGNFDLSGDPNPATAPGVGWAFYQCLPTVGGSTFSEIVSDPCLWPLTPSSFWVTNSDAGGDLILYNDGTLQNHSFFGMGNSVLVHFAPITIDDYSQPGFESSIGTVPGPCVDVNETQPIAVVYLDPIETLTMQNQVQGNYCVGRFVLDGGLPNWKDDARYKINVALATDPSVKALVQQQPIFYEPFNSISFTVSTPGDYLIHIEDSKSCGATFTIDMNGCDPSNNLQLNLPDLTAAQGTEICVPIKVKNFSTVAGSFSLNWDKSVLKYDHIGYINPLIDNDFSPDSNLNISKAALGFLGATVYGLLNPTILPDDDVLFEVCFKVVGGSGTCSDLHIVNDPALLYFEDLNGIIMGITEHPGKVCVSSSSSTKEIYSSNRFSVQPNPIVQGQPATACIESLHAGKGQLSLYNVLGQKVSEQKITLEKGDNLIQISTDQLGAGVYQVSYHRDTFMAVSTLIVREK